MATNLLQTTKKALRNSLTTIKACNIPSNIKQVSQLFIDKDFCIAMIDYESKSSNIECLFHLKLGGTVTFLWPSWKSR